MPLVITMLVSSVVGLLASALTRAGALVVSPIEFKPWWAGALLLMMLVQAVFWGVIAYLVVSTGIFGKDSLLRQLMKDYYNFLIGLSDALGLGALVGKVVK